MGETPVPHRLGAFAQAEDRGLAGLSRGARATAALARAAALLAGAALATALPTAAFADDLVLASRPVGECTLSVERSTQEPHVLRVRTFHPAYLDCATDPTALGAVLEQAVASGGKTPVGSVYSAISLGRIVDHPWLSAHLARTAAVDPRWDRRTGRPHRDDINHYVAELLSRPEVTDQLQPALTAAGYRIAHATVEKVLVARPQEIPALGDDPVPGRSHDRDLGRARDRLPFDAVLWFRLQAR